MKMEKCKRNRRSAACRLALFLLTSCLLLAGCARKDKGPEPVQTKGLPPGNALESGAEDGYSYTLYPLHAEITGYSGSGTDLKLPDTIGGKPVMSIGSGAFAGLEQLASVELPSGLRTIGQSAFDKCTALKRVVFPDTLESIGGYAFRDTALEAAEWKEGLYFIGKYAFMNTKLRTVSMPQTLSVIEKFAFSGCTELETVTFSERLAVLESRTFSGCTGLKEVVLPKTVEKVGDYCFGSCPALERAVIPGSVTSVGEGLLSGSGNAQIVTTAGSAAAKCAERNGYAVRIVSASELEAFYKAPASA